MSRYSIRSYLAGATTARTADEMSGPALLLLGLAVAGAREASLLYACLTAAAGCGGPFLGVLLDRSATPGRLLAYALAGYAAGLGLVTLALGRLPFPATLLLALAAGTLAPSVSGGWSSRLPEPRYQLDAASYSVGALLGPALAGLAAAAAGARFALLVVALLLLAAAPAAWRLPPARGAPVSLRHGLSAIVRTRPLLRITASSMLAYLGTGMLIVACPLLGQRYLGSPDRGALLLSVIAATSLAANAVLARWPLPLAPDLVFALATVVAGLAYLAIAAGCWPVVALVGVADGPQLAAIFAVRHREAPPQLRSQVFTTAASLKIAAGALGAVIAGRLAAPGLILAVAAATQAAALTVFALTSRRRRPLTS
jgi:hypothetical protein